MSPHGSSPRSETTDPCCYWCSRISLRELPSNKPPRGERELLQELFHNDCECRRRENALPSSTCGFCEHLDIRHLLHCALIRDKLLLPVIFSGWYCQESPRNECPLCEYIASSTSSELEIGLQFCKFRCEPWCDLYLHRTDKKKDWICLSQDSVPQLQEHVNWEQIRGWLPEKYLQKKNLPVNFRVIDVEKNCIVTPNYPVDYVALSYVWGSSPQKEKPFQASMRNIEDLEIEGSLSRAPLPRAITDAMEVCRELNRQYLWVDRLCILQDDESKHGQIQRMDSIFGSSEFTIIALSGQNADDALPGVFEPRRSHRLKMLKWQENVFTNLFPSLNSLVKESYWAKRGWTFQEEFCSRNNLYFTEYGVYYSTRNNGTINAECVADTHQIPMQFFDFSRSVETYARRSFTDPGDLLRAFTGVLNMEFGHSHYFGNAGLPSGARGTAFYEWIHWQPEDWEYEARRPPKDICIEPVSHTRPHKSDIFPSWSWTSAQGGVLFHQNVIPIALWAFPVAQKPQEDCNVEWVSYSQDVDRLIQFTAEGGLMRASEFPFQPTKDLELKGGLIPASLTPFEKADRDEACKNLGCILSYTQVASMRLKSFDKAFLYDGRGTFRVLSSAGVCMGGIWLPKLSLKYISNKDGSLKETGFEFMALSTPWLDYRETKRLLNGIGLEYSKDREILNVMLIWHAKGSKVARRLGIGHVFQDKWFKERPILKTVILE